MVLLRMPQSFRELRALYELPAAPREHRQPHRLFGERKYQVLELLRPVLKISTLRRLPGDRAPTRAPPLSIMIGR